MIDVFLTLIVLLVILGLVYWAAHAIIAAAGMPPLIATIVDVFLVIVAVLLLLGLLTGSMPTGFPRVHV